ncbi:unnamed protein product, partial [Vitis vinifera]
MQKLFTLNPYSFKIHSLSFECVVINCHRDGGKSAVKLRKEMGRFGIWVVGLCLMVGGHGIEGETSHHSYRNLQSDPADQPYRTAYHFQPPKNWMNGPMYYNGVYHLFYQYNPYAAVWGNITWAHSTSYDLVNWVHLELAIKPTDPFDINGCWSGSATILTGEEPVIIYTGKDSQNRQVQNLSVPKNISDPLLREWIKSPHNPLMTPIDGIDASNFRDPTTAWQGSDKVWRILSQTPLHSSNKTGMWECPDFYPVSISSRNGVETSVQNAETRHVLKASFNGNDYYIMGKYRRILWAWIQEADKDTEKGWSGLQSFPRSVLLDQNGQRLVQWPVKEIAILHKNQVTFHNKELRGGSVIEVSGITASQADVEVSFDFPHLEEAELMDPSWTDPQALCSRKNVSVKGGIGPFGLLVLASNNLTEQTAIFFRIFKSTQEKHIVLMCSDQSRSSLRQDVDKTIYGAFVDIDLNHEQISLRSLIDHSIVESFGGKGKTCITARVYPELAINTEAHLYAFNSGNQTLNISTLSAWSMKNAEMVPTN